MSLAKAALAIRALDRTDHVHRGGGRGKRREEGIALRRLNRATGPLDLVADQTPVSGKHSGHVSPSACASRVDPSTSVNSIVSSRSAEDTVPTYQTLRVEAGFWFPNSDVSEKEERGYHLGWLNEMFQTRGLGTDAGERKSYMVGTVIGLLILLGRI